MAACINFLLDYCLISKGASKFEHYRLKIVNLACTSMVLAFLANSLGARGGIKKHYLVVALGFCTAANVG